MEPISRYSRNNKQLFWMVLKWLTIYLANYVINQWPTACGPISNPSAFEVPYLVKYFGGFKYFISHDPKNQFKNVVTLLATAGKYTELLLSSRSAIMADRSKYKCTHMY